MREYPLTIPAGESRSHSVPPSNFIRIKSAVAELRYRFEDKNGVEVGSLLLAEGNKATLDREFTRVRVQNDGGTSQDVTAVIGSGDVDDSAISGTVTVGKSTAINSGSKACPATAATLILTPDSTCREVFVSVPASATDPLTIGKTGVTDGAGIIVAPGGTANIPTSAALYAYNPGSASVTVGFLEVRD